MNKDASIMLFTLQGSIEINGQVVKEKTEVKLSLGDLVTFTANTTLAQVLYIESVSINEDIAWAGPIVMNTKEEVHQAFQELNNGTFIKESMTL